MANLDSRFICTSDLELLLRDNSSGLPLSGGIVTFYSDVNRTVLKPVYQLTGMPGNYTYAPLNNPCTLSSAGTFQDALGNNIVPYYYPFTGLPTDNGGAGTGVQELYYIVVVNSGFVPQFTRQGWPQAAGNGINPVNTGNELINFIPNGQFLANNNAIAMLAPNVEPYIQYMEGTQTVNAQPIAQGGWNFIYNNSTTATFANSFTPIPNSGGFPGITSFPRYAFNFHCLSIGDTPLTRDLRIQWPDAYKFSGGVVNGVYPTYNLFFNAKSNDLNIYSFTIWQTFYLGGGQAVIENPIATIMVGSGFSAYNFPITFPTPAGSLSGKNDDYVAISIRGGTSPWNAEFTDFVMYEGDTALTSFPTDTNAEMLSQGVAGWMPTPSNTGQDLYLPLILTPQGMIFDHSQVGEIVGNFTTPATVSGISYGTNNQIYCDGSMIVTSAISPSGIPFSRLQQVLFSSSSNSPFFGTGANFVNLEINSGATSQMILGTNKAGSQTNPSDGTTATGFTFTTTAPLSNAGTAGYSYNAYCNSSNIVTAISTFTTGTLNGQLAGAGTSTFAIVNYGQGLNGSKFGFALGVLSAATLTAGSAQPGYYFTFANHATSYYVWFYINGETDPAPGGTGIRCNLISTMAAHDVANVIACILSGEQTNAITTVAATNPIPAGAWFNFYANAVEYSAWYQVAGAPTAAPGGLPGTAIMVTLAGTETAVQVATATQKSINSYSYAVPDLRGLFLRGNDPNSTWDLDAGNRWSYNNNSGGALPASFEFYQVQNHYHTILTETAGSGNVIASTNTSTPITATTGDTGGAETRPVNMTVNYYIKY